MKKLLRLAIPLSLVFLLSFLIGSVQVVAMSSEPVEPEANEAGLIANYRLDGSLEDETGNFASGEVIGDLLGESGGEITYDQAMRGQGAYFDGQSGVRLPDGLIRSNSYSVALWLKAEEITGFTPTFFGAEAEDQWVSVVPSGPNGETMVWSGEEWYDAFSYLEMPKDQWVHIAFTVDNGEIRVYINGEERFTGDDFPDVFTSDYSEFALGVNYWDTPYQGMIDDLRIYNQPITIDKVNTLAKDAPIIDLGDGPQFRNVSVHDPMITREDGTYYIFGSHLGAAKSDDLIQWESISGIVPDVEEEFKEAMQWPEPNAESTWAKSPIKINDKYYLYFSAAHWESERSAIALATADDIEGPYEYDQMLIRKYEEGNYSYEAGEPFDHNIHPGVIDPHVFWDAEDNLWMLYGTFAGGMHILELDSETGYPKNMDSETGFLKEGSGYGERMIGGHEAPMEGSYIQYNPETEYYYLFVSFGTLASDGGYNMRVVRSENPDGPYTDPQGNDMTDFMDTDINWHDWANSEPYGAKLMGNFEFVESDLGYLSPGHNSVFYEEETGKMYVVFHARFEGQGEAHQVRVHQAFTNEAGWPVIAPHRYTGESIEQYDREEVLGTYQYINHGREIQASFGNPGGNVNRSSNIELNDDGSISGAVAGSWELIGEHQVELTIEGELYQGVFLEQWDNGLREYVMAFSALSDEGVAVWGSQLVE